VIRALCVFAFLSIGLHAQEFEHAQAERAATSLKYADGIVWAREGFLVFADVVQRAVYRLDPGAPPKPTPTSDGGAQGLTYDSQARLYICELLKRRVIRMDRRGRIDTVADNFQGRKLNSPNDIVVRKDGQIYFTDPAFGSALDTRELDYNGIFHATPKGELEAVAKWPTRPNGIALSADGRTLFVADSDRHAVVAFDLSAHGGASNQRDVIKNIQGVPGGIRTDMNGRIYVAARGLDIYSAEGRLEQQLLGEEITTNCAFGDNDFETLYVAGRKTIYRIRLGVKGALQY
jgi:gluconolactonase